MIVLKSETNDEFKHRDELFDQFQNKLQKQVVGMKDEIYLEMNNRFSHQNEIVDDISKFLKAFQETLKVVGKDV